MNKPLFERDLKDKKITVTTVFDAPLKKVWTAWTDSNLLDQWWGPRPWNAVTKEMDFSVGGQWLYCMAGPQGEKHWCRVDFKEIEPEKSFTCVDSFCDENGVLNQELPSNSWRVRFEEQDKQTRVIVTITFESEKDLKKLIEMGFEQGFATGLGQLVELLAR